MQPSPHPYLKEALPGGFKVGQLLYFVGFSETFASGNRVVHGQLGEVMGPASLESHKGRGVAIRFPGNKANVNCFLTSLSRVAPVC